MSYNERVVSVAAGVCPSMSQNWSKLLLLHPFNGLFSRTTWVSWYQKGRTILDFNEARDDGGDDATATPPSLA